MSAKFKGALDEVLVLDEGNTNTDDGWVACHALEPLTGWGVVASREKWLQMIWVLTQIILVHSVYVSFRLRKPSLS